METTISLEERLILRRTEDFPLVLPGLDPFPPWSWWIVGCFFLSVTIFLVVRMWHYEAKVIGYSKAFSLIALRLSVFSIIAIIFLLPAWEETLIRTETEEKRGKILLMVDCSGSMTGLANDLQAGGITGKDSVKRQDLVVDLMKDGSRFIDLLAAKNPLGIYRFGRILDEEGLVLDLDSIHTTSEIEIEAKEYRKKVLEWLAAEESRLFAKDSLGLIHPSAKLGNNNSSSLDRRLVWDIWLRPGSTTEYSSGSPKFGAEWLIDLRNKGFIRSKSGEFSGTNIADSALRLFETVKDPTIQGLVIITDGRSTEGSEKSLERLLEVSKARNVPIVILGVGKDNEHKRTRTEIVDLRAPSIVEPGDKFRVAFEASGENRGGEKLGLGDANLLVSRIRKTPEGNVEELDIEIVEPLPPIEKGVPRIEATDFVRKKLVLGKSIPIQITGVVPVFDNSSPPRLEANFIIDANELARVVGKEKELDGKRWELSETNDSEIRIIARIKRPDSEAGDPFIVRGPVRVRVIKRPLRILLVAGAAGREYQFVRTLMVREMEKKRARVSVLLQLPPGAITRRSNIVQDVPSERMIALFPSVFVPGGSDEKDDAKDLASFDVIVAFDPDWSQFEPIQLTNLRSWVDNGGGLIIVAGPVNMLQLARPGAEHDKLRPVLDLLPVRPKDSRIDSGERIPDKPWPLAFDVASPEFDFLRLSDQLERTVEEDWADFFSASDPNGFFSYYPVDEEKKGALVVARFGDPRSALRTGEKHPWLVVTAPASGRRVVWLGSDETWRLRMRKEAFHERFWTKISRWAAGGGKSRVIPYPRNPYCTDRLVDLEVKIEDRSGSPLVSSIGARDNPKLVLTPPSGTPLSTYPPTTSLEPIPGRKGMFRASFKINRPGAYEAVVEVPTTKDRSLGVYLVVDSPPDPEQRNSLPDKDAWQRLASPFSDIANGMLLDEQSKILGGLAKVEKNLGASKLVFELENASIVPLCFRTMTEYEERLLPGKRKISDLWDRGWVFGNSLTGRPSVLPFGLLAIAVLLAIEWSLRKKFRLA